MIGEYSEMDPTLPAPKSNDFSERCDTTDGPSAKETVISQITAIDNSLKNIAVSD